jgi:hypothetical protein
MRTENEGLGPARECADLSSILSVLVEQPVCNSTTSFKTSKFSTAIYVGWLVYYVLFKYGHSKITILVSPKTYNLKCRNNAQKWNPKRIKVTLPSKWSADIVVAGHCQTYVDTSDAAAYPTPFKIGNHLLYDKLQLVNWYEPSACRAADPLEQARILVSITTLGLTQHMPLAGRGHWYRSTTLTAARRFNESARKCPLLIVRQASCTVRHLSD